MDEYIGQDQYSTSVGLIYIFNLIVGTGALTLPAVFSRAGWLLGISVILFLAFISYVTVTFVIEAMASANAIFVWKNLQNKKRVSGELGTSNSDSEDCPLVPHQAGNSNSCPDTSDRYYVIHEKIEMGEMASMFFNKFGKTLFYVCLTIYLFGDLSIYAASIGKSMTDAACTYQPPDITCNETIPYSELCWEGSNLSRMDAYRISLTIFIMAVGPFVFFNVQKTKYLQLLTSGMRWIAFGIMIIYASRILIESGPQQSPPMANLLAIPGLFGACVYSFMCHHSLPALVAPIANKSTLHRSLSFDYILIASFYLLLALTGSFAFEHLDDLYTLDFGPRGAGDCTTTTNNFLLIIEYFLTLFPVFTLSTSFPIIAITLRNNLQSLFIGNDSSYSFCLRKITFPILAIFPPYAIAMVTNNLRFLVGITGSYPGSAIQYLIPTFLVYYARKETNLLIGRGVKNKFASPFAGQFWIIFVVVWAIACMILVTVNFYEQHIQSQ